MSIRQLLHKFAEGFLVSGIFLQTSQEIFPIFQEKLDSLLMLKRHLKLSEGVSIITFESKEIGTLVETLNHYENVRIIILGDPKHIQEIAAHWKRFSPAIKKQLNIDEFVKEESIEWRLINRLEEMRLHFETVMIELKEKFDLDRGT